MNSWSWVQHAVSPWSGLRSHSTRGSHRTALSLLTPTIVSLVTLIRIQSIRYMVYLFEMLWCARQPFRRRLPEIRRPQRAISFDETELVFFAYKTNPIFFSIFEGAFFRFSKGVKYFFFSIFEGRKIIFILFFDFRMAPNNYLISKKINGQGGTADE